MLLDELGRLIRARRVILFAGAGLSVPLGLPTWNGLIQHMATDLGFDPQVLVRPGADYLQIAEYYKIEKKSIGPLRSWMDRNWACDDTQISSSLVHNQIVDLDFPLIYTTNFDRNIEKIFDIRGKKYKTIRSVLDVSQASDDETHIVKFHGDFDDDESLVLTESDFFERLQFESPLDLKFRAEALGRSILFVGYSLADPNMRLLLYRLHKAWDKTKFASERPSSYIFLMRPDPVQQAVLEHRGIRPIVSRATKPEDALSQFFAELIATKNSLA